ncbi:MAG: CCA tRNA nucleotidyltransferase [Desulfobacterales bacterium]|nr:CCA tRNA nucleotidyltransferase [Desulfobacterales bacterium]
MGKQSERPMVEQGLGTEMPRFGKAILERLRRAGYESYLVGGAVRDILLRRPAADWDVTTSAPLEKIERIFEDTRHFSLRHDTLTLVHGGRHYEVSVYRGAEGLGRTIEEDLGHRDFTINAMAYDDEKRVIIDPHEGQRDIQLGQVRGVRNPGDRFREDPLRLLRAVRLATELGFKIEERTRRILSEMTDEISSVAEERIRDELMRLLMCRRPSKGFRLMVRTGLMRRVLPELMEGYRRKQNHHHRYTIFRHVMEAVDRVEAEPILRLTALFHDIAKPRVREKKGGEYRFLGHEEASARLAEEILGRLRFGKAVIGQVTKLIETHMAILNYDSRWGDGAVRRVIIRVGPENMDRFLALRRADLLARGIKDEKLDLLSEFEKRAREIMERPLALRTRDLAIDGMRVMGILGLGPGPEVGRILRLLMEKVTDQPELNTEEGLYALLTEMPAESAGRK